MTQAQQLPGTALPWRVDERGDDETEIVGTAGPGWRRFGVTGEWSVATMDDLLCEHPDLVRANARYIVTAANAYPKLLAQRDELVDALEPFAEACCHLHPSLPDDGETLDGFKAADFRRAATALANARHGDEG